MMPDRPAAAGSCSNCGRHPVIRHFFHQEVVSVQLETSVCRRVSLQRIVAVALVIQFSRRRVPPTGGWTCPVFPMEKACPCPIFIAPNVSVESLKPSTASTARAWRLDCCCQKTRSARPTASAPGSTPAQPDRATALAPPRPARSHPACICSEARRRALKGIRIDHLI